MADGIGNNVAGVKDWPLHNDDIHGRVLSFQLQLLDEGGLLERVEGRVEQSGEHGVAFDIEIFLGEFEIAVVLEKGNESFPLIGHHLF